MTNLDAFFALALLWMSVVFALVFCWSTLVVLLGLTKEQKTFPKSEKKLKFAVFVCARNEENVIKLPVKSLLLSKYPSDKLEVIVLADNCSDATAARAREAGATVWEKTVPSQGKGDVLSWGIDKLLKRGGFDAIAVFDADNVVSDQWLEKVNDALQAGETVVTGRRNSSNARANTISGWYTVYWSTMNELSNRVRTNLGLSAKLTGTGFAFLPSVLGEEGWKTRTMVEDVEFTLHLNIRGGRIAYVQEADYSDEQPVAITSMWRQLRRWTTGGWQVLRVYSGPWFKRMFNDPSFRLFDSFFALMTGISMSFVYLATFLSLTIRLICGPMNGVSILIFIFIFSVVFFMGWTTAFSAILLSPRKRRPCLMSIFTFPFFSAILSAACLYTLIRPTKVWKPIPHGV